MLLQDYSIVSQQCQVGADHLLYLSLHLKCWSYFWYIFFAKQNWSPLKCIFQCQTFWSHSLSFFFAKNFHHQHRTIDVNDDEKEDHPWIVPWEVIPAEVICQHYQNVWLSRGRFAGKYWKTHGVPNRGKIKFSMIRMFGWAAFTSWIFLVKISSTIGMFGRGAEDFLANISNTSSDKRNLRSGCLYEPHWQLGFCWQSFQTQKESRV